jgi:anti-sigma factor RsiW
VTEHTPDDLACRDLVEMVTDFLDGALPDDQARRVAAHLDGCPGCAEYVRQIRTTARSLRGLPAQPLDPAVKASLLQAFRDFPRGTGRGRG